MLKAIPFILFILFLVANPAKAESLTLLAIPLGDGSSFDYTVDLQEQCSFKKVTDITYPSFEQAKKINFLLDKLSFFQKKLNLEIDKKEISPERISLSLKGAQNIYYEFFFKKEEQSPGCSLVRVLHFNNKTYNLDHIKVEYNTILKSPVVDKIIVYSGNGSSEEDLYLYPWQLRGQMSAYELNIGPAVNIHTNIRLNNLDKYQKNNPVVEPIPAFFFRYGPFFINKNGLGSLLYNSGNFSILGMGLLEGEPYRAQGLYDREQGVFIGSIIKYNYVEFTYYNDFLKNKGYSLKLNLAPEFFYRLSWKFAPQLFIQYWNRAYVEYYFGVKPEEVSPTWKFYKGSPTINYGTMFEINHFVKKWTFALSTGVKFYGKEVYHSPTVTRQNEVRFIATVMYKVF
ncbi:MipA/OmpV family protein [Bacteriovorax sp. PP10]|uniref:MipA/OmpV family protein n=1 Tax=Bacteriovorax antarcticus TaxID=3088717 RepID=A0ABU5VRG7_9BACT|nr:MipA/OmpV family protein [Bacteriovorax sp. PP10]MEA9355645.1 MipA/OmpV family protein [Bacteriovorax sp. PP10]